MQPLTRLVGEFVAGLDYAALPQGTIAAAKNGIADLAAVTILGRDMPIARLLRGMARVTAGGGEARLCFGADGASAVEAALINGAAGHALDYDDIGIGVHPAHPSVVLGTAVLAEGEAQGRTGRDVIAAYVTGYEVWVELGRRDRTPPHVKGWHPTATFWRRRRGRRPRPRGCGGSMRKSRRPRWRSRRRRRAASSPNTAP